MSYNRIVKPRMYMDRLSFDLATGQRTISNYTIIQDNGSSAVTYESGQLEDVFDMRPTNYVTIEKENQAFYFKFDTGQTADTMAEKNFLAILGHNFTEADAAFQLQYDDSVNMDSGTVATNACTRIINAAVSSENADYVTPTSNGWSLITWANNNTDNRYYRLIITKDGALTTNFDADVQIGAIMMGEFIDLPHSPDLNVGFDIDYDGSKTISSTGGSTFAASSHLGSPAWAATNPWVLTGEAGAEVYKLARHYGRRSYAMNLSFVSDSDLFLSNMHSASAAMVDGSDLYSQLFHKSLGSHLPFLLTIDGSIVDSEGDYGLYRLSDGGLKAKQVAVNTWNTSLNLVEHW